MPLELALLNLVAGGFGDPSITFNDGFRDDVISDIRIMIDIGLFDSSYWFKHNFLSLRTPTDIVKHRLGNDKTTNSDS
jgi:hypothetical protein